MQAVVLLSGGLDSYTAAAIARRDGFVLNALTIFYGQRHAREVDAARAVAKDLGVVRHQELAVDLRPIGGSALTANIDVPKTGTVAADIPVTYVPARNTIFLAHALGWAEVLGAQDIFIGVNALDYSGYPDCRPEFVEAFERLANLATQAGVEGRSRFRVHAPLIEQSKAQIVARAHELGVDLSLTWSCYEPERDGRACGLCDSCTLRKKGFAEARLVDPVPMAH